MKRKTVLLTGAGGFIGANIIAQGKDKFSFVAVEQHSVSAWKDEVEWVTMDLRDRKRLEDVWKQVKPVAVVHTAALADIDMCEENKALAYEMNVGVTKHLVDLSKDTGTRVLFFSTDTVFDGQEGGYMEDDVPHPLNYYGRTKVEAEQLVLAYEGPRVLFRLSLVMGLAVFAGGNSFLSRMLDTLAQNAPVYFPSAETRTPLDVVTLSRSVCEVLEKEELSGIFHLAGNEKMTRFEMAKRIAQFYGYDQSLVHDQKTEAGKSRAPRPADVSLDNGKAKRTLRTPMRDFTESLRLATETWRAIRHE